MVGKESYVGEMGEAESPPPPVPSHPRQRMLTGTSVPHFFTTQWVVRRSLSVSSHAHVASLEVCLTSCPAAFTGGWASNDSP
jgi:hypothetical protein